MVTKKHGILLQCLLNQYVPN